MATTRRTIPWNPRVPPEWEVRRAKTLMRRVKRLNTDRSESMVLSLTMRGVVENDPLSPEGLVPSDYASYQIFEPGDLVFKLIDLENLRTSRVGLVQRRGIMSSAYIRLRPHSPAVARYLYWQFYDLYNRRIFNQLGNGVRSTLGADDLLGLPLMLPPVATQTAIADFLDGETARIDQLLALKDRLDSLLQARLDAIVARATRRGLDASAPLRDSGLPWIGDVPIHWTTAPNRSFLKLRRQIVGPDGGDHTLLSLTTRGVLIRDVSDNAGKFPSTFVDYQIVHPGDLVFCLFDVPETPRTVGLSAYRGMVTGAYDVFEVGAGMSAPYLDYLYRGIDNEKSLSLFYSGLRNVIRMDDFKSIPCPIPPMVEQQEIASYLSRCEARTREARECLRHQIDLLKEYRGALINAAVTGEIDIPGVSA